MNQYKTEHPFAQFIKILGKGKKGSRALTQDEAYQAMSMILANEVEPVQLGAFLMLMRVKEETSEELAGFVEAARNSFIQPEIDIDLDWSSYAGKRRHLPWFLLSVMLLAKNGFKVFMHGASGHTVNRIYTEQAIQQLGFPAAHSLDESISQLKTQNFSYLSLEHICPILFQIINLRPVLGLRSPVHTLVRLLNPLNAQHCLQGIFHPSYRQVHQNAALLLGQNSMAVLKGEGGETERNPDVDCLVQSVKNKALEEEIWPAMFQRRHIKPEQLNIEQVLRVWEGKERDEYAEASVIATTAVALKLMEQADDQKSAQERAEHFWHSRCD